MNRCRACLMPDTRPRIVFTGGVCNACREAEARELIDWPARRAELEEILAPVRGKGAYDCVVPFSGGKDSATIAWRCKFELGLRPLLVTYGQLMWTDVGRRNFNRVIDAGFDCIYWRPDQRVSRHLARRFTIERGHPKQHYDAGVNSVPVITAKRFGIPIIFYAEHGESFYGGLVLGDESRRTRNLTEVLEHQVGDHPANWADDQVSERELWPYIYPDDVKGITAYYWSYFFPWDIYENAVFARDKIDFERAENGHHSQAVRDLGWNLMEGDKFSAVSIDGKGAWWGKSDGSFEGFDSIDDKIDDLDYYLMWIKFGFGRATRMASRLIQAGHLTREQGVEFIKRYDGEFPTIYTEDVRAYLGMTRQELSRVVDAHRGPMHGGTPGDREIVA